MKATLKKRAVILSTSVLFWQGADLATAQTLFASGRGGVTPPLRCEIPDCVQPDEGELSIELLPYDYSPGSKVEGVDFLMPREVPHDFAPVLPPFLISA